MNNNPNMQNEQNTDNQRANVFYDGNGRPLLDGNGRPIAAPAQPVQQEHKTPWQSIVSMILGIVSIIVCCCIPYFSLILSIIAIIFAIVGKKKSGKFDGFAVAGLTLGIIGTVFGLVTVIATVIVLAVDGGSFNAYLESLDSEELDKFFNDFRSQFTGKF